jgi:alpha-amylase/alpha-mannosidase (GH57 family)
VGTPRLTDTGAMQPFVIHAHFYQPERTNPWTGVLDPEPSAAPHRDWNERVHADSYRPNAFARIFDGQRQVERIVNVYDRVSFNFGPTLLRWLARRHPDTYGRVLDGDWSSVTRTGHGNALAQAYNHMILPLARPRDRTTQIRWGLADFRERFRREPQGMWLPETAADRATIDALIDEGVRFTVLAPHQAQRVREPGGSWHEVGAAVDTTRAYRHAHSDGSGRSLAVFFYNGDLAQWLAFDEGASEAARILGRIVAAAPSTGGLVHAALDGETFGHHRPFGELALAYLLFESAAAHGLEPTNYAAWLDAHPPEHEVEIVPGEGTAWSCAHGVGRWYRDCGCATDAEPGWSQAWRTPLRAALDRVADAAAAAFEDRGGDLLRDPWAARDDFVQVLLDVWTPQQFLDRHGMRTQTAEQQVDTRTLLEAQRRAMVMYTSCGWFFGDISGLESRYVMRSAARVIELLGEIGLDVAPVTRDVLDTLAEAKSNRHPGLTGADVWREHVVPDAVSPARIGAQLSLLALTQPDGLDRVAADSPLPVAGHTVRVLDHRVERRGRTALTTGRAVVTVNHTGRSHALAAAAVHLGGLDFHGLVAPDPGRAAFAEAAAPLWEGFATLSLARLIRVLDGVFADEPATTDFDLDWALPWAKQDLVDSVFSDLTERFSSQYARLYQDHRRILEMLVAAGYRLPRPLRAAAELTLTAELERELTQVLRAPPGEPTADGVFDRIRELVTRARVQGYDLDLSALREALADAVTAATHHAVHVLSDDTVDTVEQWVAIGRDLGITLDLAAAQERAWEAISKARSGRLNHSERAVVARLGEVIGFAPVAWDPNRH